MGKLKKTLFITGTGTDIGKTVITAGIASSCLNSGMKTAVIKPVQTGVGEYPSDLETIDELVPGLMKIPAELATVYSFRLPASPHLAASEANSRISPDKLMTAYNKILELDFDILLIEGVGGVYVPLKENYFVLDMIKDFDTSVIIAASSGLGTINHTLLTIEILKHADIDIAGLVFNKMPEKPSLIENDNITVIQEISQIPVLGVIRDISGNKEDFTDKLLHEFRDFYKMITL